MTIYARLENNIVKEILNTDLDVTKVFPPQLTIVACDSSVKEGYVYNNGAFNPPTPATPVYTWYQIRTKRNGLLSQSDWTQTNDSPLSTDVKQSWVQYRILLRNIPQTYSDPNTVIWPTIPLN